MNPNTTSEGIGGGRYGKETERLLRETKAVAVAVIVIGGTKGNGFDVATTNHAFGKALPELLRRMANDMDTMNAQSARQ